MKNHSRIMNWATACLNSKGYSLVGQPEMIQETPWSNVIRLSTLQGDIYLKQPAPLLANEASVIQFLAYQFNASVPCIIANMTWGELAISHPFFSLQNFLYTTTIHHGVEEQDLRWHQMVEAYIENWLDLWPKGKLLEGYMLSRKLWPIYSACVNYHFMHCVDLQALNSWYADKPNRLAVTFRQYIDAMHYSKFL